MKTDLARFAAFALALAAVPAAAGCEATTNAAKGAGAFVEKTAKTIGEKADDAGIVIAVKGGLFKADESLARQVKVGSLEGVVSLTGTVPTPEAKAKAEEIASQVKGVVRVTNAIDVGPVK
jgi:osmotically-inducible protein OsmY